MNTIQIRMMNIPKAMAMTNTALRVPHKRNIHHGSHGFQPYGVENFLETEETAVHESDEKDGEDTGAADDAGKIHMFFSYTGSVRQEQEKSLSHVSEHGAEDQGVGDGHEPAWDPSHCRPAGRTSLHTFQKV